MSNKWLCGRELIIVLIVVLIVAIVVSLIILTPGSPLKPVNKVHIVYFYRPSCENCDETSLELERINQSYPGRLEIRKFGITLPVDAETSQTYTYYLNKFDSVIPGVVPLVIVNDNKEFEGYSSIATNVEGIVNGSVIID